MSYPDTYPDIISVRSFISKQFPTLLAIREIIADAFSLVRISPRTNCKDTKKFGIDHHYAQKNKNFALKAPTLLRANSFFAPSRRPLCLEQTLRKSYLTFPDFG